MATQENSTAPQPDKEVKPEEKQVIAKRDESDKILCYGFNQDYTCFFVGSNKGFRVYNSDTFYLRLDRKVGPVCVMDLLYRSNILFYVLDTSDISRRHLHIWDDSVGKDVAVLTFASPIIHVRSLRSLVVVVLEKRMFIYDLGTVKVVTALDLPTTTNIKQLVAVASRRGSSEIRLPEFTSEGKIKEDKTKDDQQDKNKERDVEHLVISPSTTSGHVRSHFFKLLPKTKSTDPTLSIPDELQVVKHSEITAHNNELMAVTLSPDGNLVATTSEKGTVVRIFNVNNNELQYVFRRGTESAKILTLQFTLTLNKNSGLPYLFLGSDHGTLHLYHLTDDVKEKTRKGSSNLSLSSWFYSKSDQRFEAPMFEDSALEFLCAFPSTKRFYCVTNKKHPDPTSLGRLGLNVIPITHYKITYSSFLLENKLHLEQLHEIG